MDNLLSLDPGKAALAWAAWDGVDHRATLVDLALSIVDDRVPLGARALRHAEQVPHGADVVVVEEMVLPYVRQTKTPQAERRTTMDLLVLQAIGGIVAGHAVRPGGLVQYTQAVEWKGSTSKDHYHQWVRKCLEQAGRGEIHLLDEVAKKYPAKLRHNLWDAVGIGLWYTRRLRVR